MAASTSCSRRRSRKPPACSTRTARWSTSSTPRAGTCASRTMPASRARAAAPGCVASSWRPGPGCSGGRSSSARSSSPTITWTDPSFRHAEGPTASWPTSASARWSWRPSSRVTRCSARSARSPPGPGVHQAQIALVRALADHAAAAMANTRLIEDLDGSRRELAQRADSERSLRQINARIRAAADLLERAPARASMKPPVCCARTGRGSTHRCPSPGCCAGPMRRVRSSPDNPSGLTIPTRPSSRGSRVRRSSTLDRSGPVTT